MTWTVCPHGLCTLGRRKASKATLQCSWSLLGCNRRCHSGKYTRTFPISPAWGLRVLGIWYLSWPENTDACSVMNSHFLLVLMTTTVSLSFNSCKSMRILSSSFSTGYILEQCLFSLSLHEIPHIVEDRACSDSSCPFKYKSVVSLAKLSQFFTRNSLPLFIGHSGLQCS